MESQLIQAKVRWLVELVREWRLHSLSHSKKKKKKKRSKMFFPVKKLTVSFKGLLNFWNCITIWVYFRIVSVFKETELKLEQHYLQFSKPVQIFIWFHYFAMYPHYNLFRNISAKKTLLDLLFITKLRQTATTIATKVASETVLMYNTMLYQQYILEGNRF